MPIASISPDRSANSIKATEAPAIYRGGFFFAFIRFIDIVIIRESG
jgi:hypothetical protein